jgi:molybdopterin converting factor subunit 1
MRLQLPYEQERDNSQMNILLFASLAEVVGASSVQLDIACPAKVVEVKRALVETFPAAQPILTSSFAAVNLTFAADDDVIQLGDEVAFIPPVSGG